MYIKLTNNTPETYSVAQLLRDNPQVSFPRNVPDQLLAEYGVYPVVPTSAPLATETEVVEDAGYLLLSDGTWTQAWQVRAMNEQELAALAARKDVQRKRAYQNEADPLFFKWQRGEATQQQWLDKVSEIKDRA